jgi:hypothetical protein
MKEYYTVKAERNMLHAIKRRKAKWIGLIKRVTAETTEGMEIQGRRRKQLLDGLQERRRYTYLKHEALARSLRRTSFGRGSGPVVLQTMQ